MREDISIPRNGIIAKLFRVVRLAEIGGYGFDKMICGWQSVSGNKPQFDAVIDTVKATFSFRKARKDKDGAMGGQVGS